MQDFEGIKGSVVVKKELFPRTIMDVHMMEL